MARLRHPGLAGGPVPAPGVRRREQGAGGHRGRPGGPELRHLAALGDVGRGNRAGDHSTGQPRVLDRATGPRGRRGRQELRPPGGQPPGERHPHHRADPVHAAVPVRCRGPGVFGPGGDAVAPTGGVPGLPAVVPGPRRRSSAPLRLGALERPDRHGRPAGGGDRRRTGDHHQDRDRPVGGDGAVHQGGPRGDRPLRRGDPRQRPAQDDPAGVVPAGLGSGGVCPGLRGDAGDRRGPGEPDERGPASASPESAA